MDTNIICYEYGVYDLSMKSFRRTTPNDHVSFHVKFCHTIYSNDHPDIKAVNDILSKIFPVQEERQTFLEFLVKSLFGIKPDVVTYDAVSDKRKRIYMINALAQKDGSSGMSILFNLIRYTIGDLAHILSIADCINDRGFISFQGKRLLLVDLDLTRPDEKDIQRAVYSLIRLQNLKHDDTTIRSPLIMAGDPNNNLGYEGYKPMFNVLSFMNPIVAQSLDTLSMPNCELCRKDTRILSDLVVRHPLRSVFKKNPDPSHQNEFQADHNLYNGLKNLAPAFMSILVAIAESFST